MAIFTNDNFEVRKASPIDTRDQVATYNDLVNLDVSYNYLGMLVTTVDTLRIYRLATGSGSALSNWLLLETKVVDDKAPQLGGNLDAAGFNITNAGIIQGHRASALFTTDIVIGATHANKMARFGIGANTSITIADGSNNLPIDTEIEVFQQSGAFDIEVLNTGLQLVISKDDNRKVDGVGSAIVIKKIGANLWSVVGDLKA